MMDLISRMEARKNSVSVTQHKYNQFRSRVPRAEIAIVEGSEDAVFFSSVFCREKYCGIEHFFIANGKDNVLGLRDIMLQSKDTIRGDGVVFFVDHDYDGFKNHCSGKDVYITPTYSIENILVCRDAFRRLLLIDLRLSSEEVVNDVDSILNLFDKLIDMHSQELREVNEKIHYIRRERLKGNSLASGSISGKEKLFADLEFETLSVKKHATGSEIERLISASEVIGQDRLLEYREDFEKLNPKNQWRGKFIFYLFRRFISILVEDRNSDSPRYFSKGRGKVSLNVTEESFIRTLALMCTLPECLIDFVKNIPNQKLC